MNPVNEFDFVIKIPRYRDFEGLRAAYKDASDSLGGLIASVSEITDYEINDLWSKFDENAKFFN